jgi:hypothetical protein
MREMDYRESRPSREELEIHHKGTAFLFLVALGEFSRQQ